MRSPQLICGVFVLTGALEKLRSTRFVDGRRGRESSWFPIHHVPFSAKSPKSSNFGSRSHDPSSNCGVNCSSRGSRAAWFPEGSRRCPLCSRGSLGRIGLRRVDSLLHLMGWRWVCVRNDELIHSNEP